MKTIKIATEVVFSEKGTFQSYYAAKDWCIDNGYSYGSMCRGLPIALIKGNVSIAKWRNLTKEEKSQVDGVMISNDFREGSVIILIYDK